MKKIISLYILCFFIGVKNVFASSIDSQYIDFSDLVDRYLKNEISVVNDVVDDKKTRLDDTFYKVYYNNPKKFTIKMQYLRSFRVLTDGNKEFLTDWNKLLRKENLNKREDDKISKVLAESDMDLFYQEVQLSSGGSSYWIPVQKIIAESMYNELKSGDIINAEVLIYGRRLEDSPMIVLLNYKLYDKTDKKTKETEDISVKYLKVVKLIRDKKYTTAVNALNTLLKQYPNNKQVKIDLCLLKGITSNKKDDTCFKDLLKANTNSYELYYGIAKLYYDSKDMDIKIKSRNMIRYLDKAIYLVQDSNDKQSFYNALYMRGVAKIRLKDKSAIYDFERINRERPDLLSNEALYIMKRKINDMR